MQHGSKQLRHSAAIDALADIIKEAAGCCSDHFFYFFSGVASKVFRFRLAIPKYWTVRFTLLQSIQLEPGFGQGHQMGRYISRSGDKKGRGGWVGALINWFGLSPARFASFTPIRGRRR